MENLIKFIVFTMTILSPILFIIGVSSIETPDTAIPEIMLLIALGWLGFIIYSDERNAKAEATHGKNRR